MYKKILLTVLSLGHLPITLLKVLVVYIVKIDDKMSEEVVKIIKELDENN